MKSPLPIILSSSLTLAGYLTWQAFYSAMFVIASYDRENIEKFRQNIPIK